MNDVALYLPNSDAWAHFRRGRVNLLRNTRASAIGPRRGAARFWKRAMASISSTTPRSNNSGAVDEGALVLGGNRYRAVVLPDVESHPGDDDSEAGGIRHGGGIVIATRRIPTQAPGFMATEAETAEVRETVRRLFEAPSGTARLRRRRDRSLAGRSRPLLPPDVSLSPRRPGDRFRPPQRTGSAEIYFLANTDNVRRRDEGDFPRRGNGSRSGGTR